MGFIETAQKTLLFSGTTARFAFRIREPAPPGSVLDIDIYRAGRREHPDSHIGWWKYSLNPGLYTVSITLGSDGETASVAVRTDGELPCREKWEHPESPWAPRQDLLLVARRDDGSILETVQLPLLICDDRFLRRFYRDLHRSDDRPNAFLRTLHTEKLRILQRILPEFLDTGASIMDIGSAYSVLSQVQIAPEHPVYCLDIGEELVLRRSREMSRYHWMVGDARTPPVRDEVFDMVFAGEIIEHFPEGEIDAIFQEWRRILKPGGVLVITTPNRRRFLNRLNRSENPFGPDHYREFSYPEMIRRMQSAGFVPCCSRGLYVELFCNYLSARPHVDLLQTRYNSQQFIPLMRILGRIGRFVPSLALELIVISRKDGS